jgi:hypothetical protein
MRASGTGARSPHVSGLAERAAVPEAPPGGDDPAKDGDARLAPLALREIRVRQRHIALDHVECGVAEDSLEAERVAAVDEVAPGGRVAVHLPRMVGRVERRVSDEETAASIDNGCDTSTSPKMKRFKRVTPNG